MPRLRAFVSAGGLVVAFALIAWGCSGASDENASGQPAAAQGDTQRHLSTSGFRVDSASFQEKVRPYVRIPPQHTCFEGNTSPPLSWNQMPAGTKSLALIAEDVDHHTGDWVHWVLYNIPAEATALPEGISTSTEVLPDGTTQGTNDNRNIGYNGPCPPPNITFGSEHAGIEPPHKYYFRLYALDADIGLAPGATKEELIGAMEGHILGQANTMGKYTRPLQLEGTQAMKDALTATVRAGRSPTPAP